MTLPVSKRVAVVAIHGVADQQPHETAQTIAGMLLGLRDDATKERIYSDFREFELRIPVERTLEPRATLPKPDYLTFDPRNALFKELHTPEKGPRAIGQRLNATLKGNESVVAAEEKSVRETLEHEVMLEQIEHYSPVEADRLYKTNDSVYETVQLTGLRTDEAPAKRPEVHLYEMYWADLSRVGSAILRVVVDFYQLLAYLCGVGRKTLYFAQAESLHNKQWDWLRRSQLIAECMLTLAIPVVNLCLLALAAIVLPFQLTQHHSATGLAASSITVAIVCSGIIYCKRQSISPNSWPWMLLIPVFCAVVALMCGKCAEKTEPPHTYAFYSVLAFGLWLILAGLVLWAMKSYNARRTGALLTGIIVTVLTSVIYAIELWLYASSSQAKPIFGPRILAAASETAGWLCIFLVVCWVVFIFFAMLTSIFGFLIRTPSPANGGNQPGRDKSAIRRAIWTANLTLIFPGALTLVFNLGIWQALSIALRRLKDHPVALNDNWLFRFLYSSATDSTQRVMDGIINAFASGWFTIFFLSFCVAALIAVWALLPAVISGNPAIVDHGKNAKVIGDSSAVEEEAASKWLGENLSKGYRTMRVSGEILRVLLFLGFFVAVFLVWQRLNGKSDFTKVLGKWGSIKQVLPALGLILLVMFTASQGFFRFLALGFRSTVDIALDVANWLRSNPLNANPKARITARCVSQLKYLAKWHDPRDGGKYDAFVIIAHSQGTVIISEILRFLQAEHHSVISEIGDRPVYLFTMGSPLRQLYSLRFPHQYAWARHNAAKWAGTDPNPQRLGIAEWVNAYRSGDYVGRYLWHPDKGDDSWSFNVYAENGNYARREFCIGAGAHTHYWDETAPQIARELDRLIVDACAAT
jgi:hypothetical protein